MQVSISPKDFELTMASIVIDVQEGPSITAKVLAELIRCSTGGVIGQPAVVGPQLMKLLNISDVNYRRIMVKLTKLKLIKREDGAIVLNFIKTGSPDPTSLLIKQK